MRIRWEKFQLDHPLVADHVANLIREHDKVMIHHKSVMRKGRNFLHLHQTKDGRLFVNQAGGKRYVESCEVTYLDDGPALYRFILERYEWEKRYQEEFDRKHGIE